MFWVHCDYKGKVDLKFQKLRWTNIFTIKMFVFTNFIQKFNFEQSVSEGVFDTC